MIKKLAWDAFKNTGNINTFLEFKEIESVEKNLRNADFNSTASNYFNNSLYTNLEKENGNNKN